MFDVCLDPASLLEENFHCIVCVKVSRVCRLLLGLGLLCYMTYANQYMTHTCPEIFAIILMHLQKLKEATVYVLVL